MITNAKSDSEACTETFPLKLCFRFSISIALVLSWLSISMAATDHWDSGATGAWNSSNWDTGSTYTSNNDAYVSNGNITIAAGTNIDMGTGDLRIGNSAGSSGLLTIEGDFRANRMRVGNSGTGNIVVNSGNIKADGSSSHIGYSTGSVGYLHLNHSVYRGAPGQAFTIGREGSGVLTASNSILQDFQAFYLASNSNSTGNLYLYGSNLISTGQFYIANGSDSVAQLTISSSNTYGKNFNIASGTNSHATVNIENSFVTSINSSPFHGAQNGVGNLHMTGSNISGFNTIYFGAAANSQSYANINYSSLEGTQDLIVGNSSTSKSHLVVNNSTFKTTGSNKNFKIGTNAYVSISNSDIIGYGYFNTSQLDNSSSNLVLSGTNIAISQAFRLPRADYSSGNTQVINGCNLSSGPNNGFNVCYGINSYGEFIAKDSFFNLQGGFLLASVAGSHAKFHMVNNDIHVNGSSKNFVFGNSGNAEGSIQGGNISGFHNIIFCESANTHSQTSMSDMDTTIASNFYVSDGYSSHSNLIMNNMTIRTSGTDKDIRLSSGNSSSSNVIISNSNFAGFRHMYIGGTIDNAMSNVIITSSNISLSNNFRVGNSSDAFPSSVYVSHSNIIASQLTLSNNALFRLTGGSSNFIVRTSFNSRAETRWEQIIDSKNGPFGHMPTVYSLVNTDTEGHLKIGFNGGSAFVSSNVFFPQVSTTGHNKTSSSYKYSSTPSHWELSLQDPAPDGLYKVKATMSAANLVCALDLAKGGAKSIAVGGNALGYVSVANVNPNEQIFGLNVLFQLASGTPQNIVNDLILAGYDAELTSFGSYQFKYRIPVADLVTGTGYLMWDFRDITTGATEATVQQLMVAPVVSGSTIVVQ